MSVEGMLEAIKKQLENHEKRISHLEAQPKIKEEPTTKKLSIREFLISKKPKTDVDKTLVISYHLESYQDYPSFNIAHIENGFRSAKETVPQNINDIINKNIRKGFIMDTEDKKDGKRAWVLTNLGLQYIENGLKKLK